MSLEEENIVYPNTLKIDDSNEKSSFNDDNNKKKYLNFYCCKL